MSGQQYDNSVVKNVIEPAKINNVYNEKNGTSFRIDHIIQSPVTSVSKMLQSYDQFSEFYQLCAGFSADELLSWAGISNELNDFGTTEQDAYVIFTSNRGSGTNEVKNCCLDENVKMFNTYNYTLYAPNNDAMKKAYEAGLPNWDTIVETYETYSNEDEFDADEVAAKKAEVKAQINMLRDFARYHFQSVSLYADNATLASDNYSTLSTDDMGLSLELKVRGGNGKLVVTDALGVEHTIDANSEMKSNLMTRDYWFDTDKEFASSIYTSSFCVIHEISSPLNSGKTGIKWDASRKQNSKRISKNKK